MHYDLFGRETMFNIMFVSVLQANTTLGNVYDGLIGLLPGSKDRSTTGMGFLEQLQSDGLIESQCASFYIRADNGTAVIKFGSYDIEGYAKGENLTSFQTVNNNSWMV